MEPARSAEQTKHSIAAAMYTLLEHKDFDDITIADICQSANVSRSTFYNHFEDKYELVVSSIKQFIENSCTMDIEDPDDLRRGYNELIDCHLERFQALRNLVHHETIYELKQKMDKMFLEHYLRLYRMKEEQGYVFNKPLRLLAEYNSGGSAAVMSWWIHDQHPIEREEVVEYLVCKMLHTMDFCHKKPK